MNSLLISLKNTRARFRLTLRRTAACRAEQRWGWRETVETAERWWSACCWATR